jgi:hypothetical protein
LRGGSKTESRFFTHAWPAILEARTGFGFFMLFFRPWLRALPADARAGILGLTAEADRNSARAGQARPVASLSLQRSANHTLGCPAGNRLVA